MAHFCRSYKRLPKRLAAPASNDSDLKLRLLQSDDYRPLEADPANCLRTAYESCIHVLIAARRSGTPKLALRNSPNYQDLEPLSFSRRERSSSWTKWLKGAAHPEFTRYFCPWQSWIEVLPPTPAGFHDAVQIVVLLQLASNNFKICFS